MAKKPVDAIPAGVKVVKRKGKGQKKKKNGPHQNKYANLKGIVPDKPMTPGRLQFLKEREEEEARLNEKRAADRATEAAAIARSIQQRGYYIF